MALDTLGVYLSAVLVEFYSRFVGTFGSDTEPFELLELYENGDDNIAHLTQEARDAIGLDSLFLTLTPYGDGGFLILDTESDHAYYADAEGGTKDAANGLLEPYALHSLSFSFRTSLITRTSSKCSVLRSVPGAAQELHERKGRTRGRTTEPTDSNE